MKYLEKFIKYFTDILLVIVIMAVLVAGYSLVQLAIFDKDYVNYFGYTIFEVESGSMSPTINIDDMILVKVNTEVAKGDIITYKQDDDFITHRVVKVLDDKLITKGDYNNSEDKVVSKDMVLGKIVKVFPKFGVWREILLSPKVIILVFITLILFSFGCAYTGKKKNSKLEQEQEEKEKKQSEIRKNLEEENKKQSEIRKNLEAENKKLKEELEKENEKKRLREEFENEKKKLKDAHEVEKRKLKDELESEKRKLKEEKEKHKKKQKEEEIELLEFEVEEEIL